MFIIIIKSQSGLATRHSIYSAHHFRMSILTHERSRSVLGTLESHSLGQPVVSTVNSVDYSIPSTTCTSFLDPASSYGKPSSFSLPDSNLLAPSDDQTSKTKETLFSEPSNKRTTLRMIAFLLRSLFFFYYILLQYISGCHD